MKIKDKRLMMWLIVILPVVDIFNGFLMKVMEVKGFGILMHGMIFAYMLKILIFNGKILKRDLGIFFIGYYLTAQTVVTNLMYSLSIAQNFSYIVKYIYFFVILATLDKLKYEKNIWLIIKGSYTWIYPMGVIFPKILGYDFSSYGGGEGSLGFMYSKNSYTFVMIVALYWSLEYMLKKANISNMVRTLLCMVSLLLIGSKSGYVFAVIIVSYMILRNLKGKKVGNIIRSAITVIVVFDTVLLIVSLFSDELHLIYLRVQHFYNYYGHNSINAVLNFLTSDRWDRIDGYFSDYSRNAIIVFMGLGYAFFNEQVTTEMDIFNLLFLFGVIGLVLYIYIFINISRIRSYKNDHKGLLVCLFIYLFFGGHVLSDVMANGVLALVIVMGQNERLFVKKDRIGSIRLISR